MPENKLDQGLCQLSELNLSCFGCCGHDFANKSILKRDIRINTRRFYQRLDNIEKLKNMSKKVRKSGICKFVIYLDGKVVGCPLHPLLNEGVDLRKGHCDIDYVCTTNREFANWDDTTREKFIEYIRNKNLDIVDYSLGIDNGSLLRGFKLKNRGKNLKK